MRVSIETDNSDFVTNAELLKQVINKMSNARAVSLLEIRSGDIIKEFKGEELDLIKDLVRRIKIIQNLSFRPKEAWQRFVMLLLEHPIGAYLFLKRFALAQKVSNNKYDNNISKIISILEDSKVIKKVKPYIIGKSIEDREAYSLIFSSYERTSISNIRYVLSSLIGFRELERYPLKDGSKVSIMSNNSEFFYLLTPSEFLLNEKQFFLIKKAINELHLNKAIFKEDDIRIATDEFLRDFFVSKNLNVKEIEKLTDITLRNSVGLGFVEILSLDDNLEDFYINPRNYSIFVKHKRYGYMKANISISENDIKALIAKLRLVSSRPLDESNPILDLSLSINKVKLRINVAIPPFSYRGISFSVRRHAVQPLTLPYLVKTNFLSSEAAALLHIISNQNAALLISGNRGAGKTTLLSSLLFEMPKENRIVILEETEEMPVDIIEKLGYNVVSLKVKGSLSYGQYGISTQDGIRASLRLGDSCLIIGEVRGKEAVALYEAMRIGALSNLVAGTIHSESVYGVYDRVINDLGVKPASFKATDLIILVGLIKNPFNVVPKRRVLEITEVKKHWDQDPLKEKGFNTLFKYNYNDDKLIALKNWDNSEFINTLIKRMSVNKETFMQLFYFYKAIIEYLSLKSSYDTKYYSPLVVTKANEIAKQVLLSFEGKEFSWKEGFEKWKLMQSF